MFDLFQKYQSQVEKDLKFDAYSVQDVCMRLPGLKHFWIGKLVEAKISLKKLEDKKKELLEELQSNIRPEIGLSKASLSNIALNNSTVKEINSKIDEYKLVIEYLEKVERIFHSMSYDLKNYIETIKIDEVK